MEVWGVIGYLRGFGMFFRKIRIKYKRGIRGILFSRKLVDIIFIKWLKLTLLGMG